MKNDSQKSIKAYLKEVRRELKCSKVLSSVFKKKISVEIYAYAEYQETLTYEMLVKQFGEPQAIADSFFERDDYAELLKISKKKECFWKWAAIIAIVFIIIVIAFLVGYIHDGSGEITITNPISL